MESISRKDDDVAIIKERVMRPGHSQYSLAEVLNALDNLALDHKAVEVLEIDIAATRDKLRKYRDILERIGHQPNCDPFYGGCGCLEQCISMAEKVLNEGVVVEFR